MSTTLAADSLEALLEKLVSDARQQQRVVCGNVSSDEDREASDLLDRIAMLRREGFCSWSERGPRDTQEDRSTIVPDLRVVRRDLPRRFSYIAVFDGHEGSSAAEFAHKHLHRYLCEQPSFPDNIPVALDQAFLKTNERFLGPPKLADDPVQLQYISGSTAVVAVIDWANSLLYTAHVGDSRALLVHKDGSVTQLTQDQTGQTLTDAERGKIKETGVAMVIGSYIWVTTGGNDMQRFSRHSVSLEVSRALGDPLFKAAYNPLLHPSNYDVIPCRPVVGRFEISGERDWILMLGSDGVFKTATNSDVAHTLQQATTAAPDATGAPVAASASSSDANSTSDAGVAHAPPHAHGAPVATGWHSLQPIVRPQHPASASAAASETDEASAAAAAAIAAAIAELASESAAAHQPQQQQQHRVKSAHPHHAAGASADVPTRADAAIEGRAAGTGRAESPSSSVQHVPSETASGAPSGVSQPPSAIGSGPVSASGSGTTVPLVASPDRPGGAADVLDAAAAAAAPAAASLPGPHRAGSSGSVLLSPPPELLRATLRASAGALQEDRELMQSVEDQLERALASLSSGVFSPGGAIDAPAGVAASGVAASATTTSYAAAESTTTTVSAAAACFVSTTGADLTCRELEAAVECLLPPFTAMQLPPLAGTGAEGDDANVNVWPPSAPASRVQALPSVIFTGKHNGPAASAAATSAAGTAGTSASTRAEPGGGSPSLEAPASSVFAWPQLVTHGAGGAAPSPPPSGSTTSGMAAGARRRPVAPNDSPLETAARRVVATSLERRCGDNTTVVLAVIGRELLGKSGDEDPFEGPDLEELAVPASSGVEPAEVVHTLGVGAHDAPSSMLSIPNAAGGGGDAVSSLSGSRGSNRGGSMRAWLASAAPSAFAIAPHPDSPPSMPELQPSLGARALASASGPAALSSAAGGSAPPTSAAGDQPGAMT